MPNKIGLSVLLTDQLQIGGSNNPLLGFSELARVAHRTQRNSLLTRLWVYYRRIYLRNSQIEEMCRTRMCGGKAWSFHAFSGHIFSPNLCLHQPGSSQNPILLRFYGSFMTEAWLIKLLAIGDWIQSLALLSSEVWVQGGGSESFNSWFPGQTAPSSLKCLSKVPSLTKDIFPKEILSVLGVLCQTKNVYYILKCNNL